MSYRGFEIEQKINGDFRITENGGVVHNGIRTVTNAQLYIDSLLQRRRAKAAM